MRRGRPGDVRRCRTGCRRGPLHDAAEVAGAGVPTVMMFVQSLHGISHNKIEETKEEHLAPRAAAFDRLGGEDDPVDRGRGKQRVNYCTSRMARIIFPSVEIGEIRGPNSEGNGGAVFVRITDS
jgi:hypothetical protein